MAGLVDGFGHMRWLLDIIDIGLVAFIIYRIILLIKGTRAVQMLLGLVVILIVYTASQVGGLYTLHWLLDNFLSSIILVIVVIFQNDIRRALIHVGRNPFFADMSFREGTEVIEELVKACVTMAGRRIGALIVIERETGLKDFLEVGVELDAKVNADLVVAIFNPKSPIHDGALVLQQGRLKRAGCFLPLAQDTEVSRQLGTRHRAAVGLTELVDAVAIVVSEETGKISVVIGGRITRDLDAASLKRVLSRLLAPRERRPGGRKQKKRG
ncbi:MAG: TIGR00159 family protein [Deltaproteobacteria bacterium]|nr:MAG: TIGR00159 family protein [Deltaproteobacteria bacterium]